MKKTVARGENVRKVTAQEKNLIIDRLIISNIKSYSDKSAEEISDRIQKLDKEWDIEKILEIGLSGLAILGIISSILFNPYSIILTIILLLFFIWHGIQGWCPPIPLLRYFKIRTRPEIDREKYALKAIRGDFNDLHRGNDLAIHAFESTKKI